MSDKFINEYIPVLYKKKRYVTSKAYFNDKGITHVRIILLDDPSDREYAYKRNLELIPESRYKHNIKKPGDTVLIKNPLPGRSYFDTGVVEMQNFAGKEVTIKRTLGYQFKYRIVGNHFNWDNGMFVDEPLFIFTNPKTINELL